ncbi:MAG: dihydrolipoyllysine-residue succinyltransferase [Alphaproteobacteria bacterium]|nr:dihydrolipoyllysine-residue succinyltransferase [Alphaproteobacteria bacterium]|tara:strand:- start:588531 stop:589745 length:1215 start_codon:yes stop_codon:yes gene_type:complete
MTEILVPTLGESVSEATVATWLKKEGEAVKADEPIVELETDKVTLEVNAPSDGVIVKISAAEGENVEVGALLGEIDANAAANDTKPAAAEKPAEASAPATDDDASGHKLSPAVQKMVDEHSLDPSKITGTGKDGRLIKEDVQNFLDNQGKAAETPAPQAVSVPPAPQREAGEREERVRMTRLRQSIAKRLKEAQNTAAMLTTFNEVDMTAVMEMRKQYKDVFEKKHGTKLGFMSFFVKACVNALNEFPAVNAEIQGDEIVYKNYCDIGVAVSTPQGLVVPVLRGCEDRNMANIESSIVELGTKAREGKISIDDMTGGSFTITNGGVFGSLMSTPILNAPQSGILGMHKIQQRPMVMADGSIEARPMMYIALSYDHRIIDGREAVSFLVRIKDSLEDPQRMILEI